MKKKNNVSATKHNPIAKDLHKPKYYQRVVPSKPKKEEYTEEDVYNFCHYAPSSENLDG